MARIQKDDKEVPIYSIKKDIFVYNRRIQFDPIHPISVPNIIVAPYEIMKARHSSKKHTHSKPSKPLKAIRS